MRDSPGMSCAVHPHPTDAHQAASMAPFLTSSLTRTILHCYSNGPAWDRAEACLSKLRKTQPDTGSQLPATSFPALTGVPASSESVWPASAMTSWHSACSAAE